jgi:hypothetical protein
MEELALESLSDVQEVNQSLSIQQIFSRRESYHISFKKFIRQFISPLLKALYRILIVLAFVIGFESFLSC